jgi:hypothetical protein
MLSMSSLFRRGGPLAGPRLLVALLAVVTILFYLSQPYNPQPTSGAGIPNPHHEEKEQTGGTSFSPPGSLGEASPAPPPARPNEKESLSDKFLEYLKGHSSHALGLHPPIPHLEHANGAPPPPVPSTVNATTSKDPFCSHLPSTEHLLIVVRTQASELYTHLPAHFFTTLRCAPFLLYSTVSQNMGSHVVHDSLANISDSRRSKHKDFELYNKLQRAQNAVADMGKFKEDDEHNLQKWSIIPHILSAYHLHPEKEWFVFIESDTYLSLSNMLKWFKQMDPETPIYAGAQVMLGDVELANSGAGIVLSRAAIRELATLSKKRKEAWEELVGQSCCGDKILAEALREANITLHRSFPMIQGEGPFSLDWSENHWCRSTMSWHRMTPAMLDMSWQFEQEWVKKHSSKSGPTDLSTIPPMLYKDYFQLFLVPLIRASQNRSDWDNLSASQTLTDSGRSQFAHVSFDSCRAACDLRHSCVQYAWEPNKCRLGNVVRMGDSVDSDKRMMSGWVAQRVEKFGEKVGECKESQAWILPDSKAHQEDEQRKEKERIEEEKKEMERIQQEEEDEIIEKQKKEDEKKQEEMKEEQRKDEQKKADEQKKEDEQKTEEEQRKEEERKEEERKKGEGQEPTKTEEQRKEEERKEEEEQKKDGEQEQKKMEDQRKEEERKEENERKKKDEEEKKGSTKTDEEAHPSPSGLA